HFLALAEPPSKSAPADFGLTFKSQSVTASGRPSLVRTAWLALDAPQVTIAADAARVTVLPSTGLAFPGGGKAPGPNGVLDVDLNSDFYSDLVCAGAGGLRIYRHADGKAAAFTDATAAAKLPAAVAAASYTGAWAAPVYVAGNVDVVLGSSTGQPTVLRN